MKAPRSMRFGIALVTILAGCNLILDNELRPSGDADSAGGRAGGDSGSRVGGGGVASKGRANGSGAAGEGGTAGAADGAGEGGEGGEGGVSGQCRPGDERPCSFVNPTLVGDCANGKVSCGSDGTWSECDVKPGKDSCLVAGDDADCDGTPSSGCLCVDGDTQPCGVDTDVGICDFGLSTCESQAWGPCEGAVTREARDCRSTQDNDCDGARDDSLDETCQCVPGSSESCDDEARDGVGSCRASTRSCVSSFGISSTAWGECEGGVHPGKELCNADGADEDCDGMTNEGCSCANGTKRGCGNCEGGSQTCVDGAWGNCSGEPGPPVTYYLDQDDDDYGVASQARTSCTGLPDGYAVSPGDCCDADGRVHPGAAFVAAGDGGCGRSGDFDCNGVVEYGYTALAEGCCEEFCLGGWSAGVLADCGVSADWIDAPWGGLCPTQTLTQVCR